MQHQHCFYTSFNKAYAGQALMLAESIRRQYGDTVAIVALLIDRLEEDEKKAFAIFDKLLFSEELDIPNFDQWLFGLNIVEAATAVKPYGLCYLLKHYPHVTYLDPDTVIYTKLDEIVESKDSWNIALTPHQISPQKEEWVIASTEMESLKFGVYNLGFLSVRATTEGIRVAEWWRDRCYKYCIDAVERGLFTDQKLFDMAPAIFNGVYILRHPGYNIATWNIREREVVFNQDEGPLSNGQPLRFCHFTKATHIGAAALDKMLGSASLFEELFYSYVSQLQEKNGSLASLDKRWAFGFYESGEPISNDLRKKFRAAHFDNPSNFNPFSSPSLFIE